MSSKSSISASASPQLPASIRVPLRSTASSLLANFLPRGSPVDHKMNVSPKKLRKSTISYAESDGSENSPPQTPEKDRIDLTTLEDDDVEVDDEADDSEDDLIMYEERRLRPRKTTKINARKNKKGSSTRSTAPNAQISDRRTIRNEIETVTAANRDRFLLSHKDYFLPLLPKDNNYIKKLIRQNDGLSQNQKASLPTTIPYEELQAQPQGIKSGMQMKPYQISGLSFMIYLHRNGLSGILGDEMGLGKTFQTLSLIQYLKENTPKAANQTRPFLVICPLSVLSSWMKEAKKWTPGLKVLRFHGSVKERDRLKRVALGQEDMYGNVSQMQRAKINSRRAAKGRSAIYEDDSDEADDGSQIGVDVVITTYEGFLAEQGWFKRSFVWRYAVLDEGHKVKNEESLISKGLQGLQAEYRLILTGTPLQNNLAELWALLHWLYPDVFTEQSRDLFRQSFDLSKGLYSDTILDASRHLLELIMLRRMKNSPGVDINLPPKTEVLLFVPLSPMQRFWYTRLITRADEGLLNDLFKGAKDKVKHEMDNDNQNEAKMLESDIKMLEASATDMVTSNAEWNETREILARTLEREEAEIDNKTSAWRKLMNLMMQLRKVCNHPYQITNAEPDPYELGDHIITASGKFIVLEKLIAELVIKQKKKILIFSGFTRMLDLVQDFLAIRGGDGSEYRVCRLDGGTGRARRNLGIHMFNDDDSEYRVMLISTRAGGLGINLATASDVILLDQDWNPQITLQAEARAHRIGQKNPVTVYKLVSQGTVEEQMMGRIQKKLYLSAKVTESMQDIHTPAGKKSKRKGGPQSANDDMPQLSTGQLMALVRRGTSALSRPEIDINEMLSWDWETTVANCKDKPADVGVKRDAVVDATVDADEEQKWLSAMERVEASVFEGKKLARQNGTGKSSTSASEIAKEWNRADRRVGKETTVMIDGFAISKESIGCADWEAVPTMAGKDPRLADVKREAKAAVNHQSHCQVCLDGGELKLCQLCPRAYHVQCLTPEFQSKAKGWQFNCPQHQCADCDQKTTDAGGMLYRCRWCERAYCEDCLDLDDVDKRQKIKLIGDNLMEYELLSYPVMVQAFYIQCSGCHDHFIDHPEDKELVDVMAASTEEAYDAAEKALLEGASEAESMTDATTATTTGGVNTPVVIDEDDAQPVVNSKKRKGGDKASTKVKITRHSK